MKKKQNSCYTCFGMTGIFDPDEITRILELQPSKCWHVGDERPEGINKYEFALWEYGRCDEYKVYTEEQMLCTITELKAKISLLKEIKDKYIVEYALEVVPELYVGEATPDLSPSMEIIEFCYMTGTNLSIDLYLFR